MPFFADGNVRAGKPWTSTWYLILTDTSGGDIHDPDTYKDAYIRSMLIYLINDIFLSDYQLVENPKTKPKMIRNNLNFFF